MECIGWDVSPYRLRHIAPYIAENSGGAHEMMRRDRDLHVRILKHNLQRGSEKQFKIKDRPSYDTRRTPFDFQSVLMYGPTDFGQKISQGKFKKTIEPLRPEDEIR